MEKIAAKFFDLVRKFVVSQEIISCTAWLLIKSIKFPRKSPSKKIKL